MNPVGLPIIFVPGDKLQVREKNRSWIRPLNAKKPSTRFVDGLYKNSECRATGHHVLSVFGTVIGIVISAPTGISSRPASGEITEAKDIVRVAEFVITVFRLPTPTSDRGDCGPVVSYRPN
jgi:hypothetical protein